MLFVFDGRNAPDTKISVSPAAGVPASPQLAASVQFPVVPAPLQLNVAAEDGSVHSACAQKKIAVMALIEPVPINVVRDAREDFIVCERRST